MRLNICPTLLKDRADIRAATNYVNQASIANSIDAFILGKQPQNADMDLNGRRLDVAI